MWERVYGHPHGAPELLAGFLCAVPELAPKGELAPGVPARAVAHPGLYRLFEAHGMKVVGPPLHS